MGVVPDPTFQHQRSLPGGVDNQAYDGESWSERRGRMGAFSRGAVFRYPEKRQSMHFINDSALLTEHAQAPAILKHQDFKVLTFLIQTLRTLCLV